MFSFVSINILLSVVSASNNNNGVVVVQDMCCFGDNVEILTLVY